MTDKVWKMPKGAEWVLAFVRGHICGSGSFPDVAVISPQLGRYDRDTRMYLTWLVEFGYLEEDNNGSWQLSEKHEKMTRIPYSDTPLKVYKFK